MTPALDEHYATLAAMRKLVRLCQENKTGGRTDPLIANVHYYAQEHLCRTRARKNATYNVYNLVRWRGDKRDSCITAVLCREHAVERTQAAARRDLETLRAGIRFCAANYASVAVPRFALPPKSEPTERWLTREEAKRTRAAMK
jgi:hypothetical protein